MRTQTDAYDWALRPNKKRIRFSRVLSWVLSPLRAGKKLANWKRGKKAFGISQTEILVLHDPLCPQRLYYPSGMESIPMDLEKVSRFRPLGLETVGEDTKLDRSERDYIFCGNWFQSTSTFDCRFYHEDPPLQRVTQNVGRSSDIQSALPYIEGEWTANEGSELPFEVYVEEEQPETILGWSHPTPMLPPAPLPEGEEQDFTV